MLSRSSTSGVISLYPLPRGAAFEFLVDVLFRDCQVSGVVQLAINLVILVLTLLIFVWTSSSSVGGYLPRKLSNKIFSSSSLGSVFSASEGSTLTFSTAAAGFLRTGDAMAIEAGRYRTNVVPLSWSVSSMIAAVSFGPADEPLKMPWQDIPDKPTISPKLQQDESTSNQLRTLAATAASISRQAILEFR